MPFCQCAAHRTTDTPSNFVAVSRNRRWPRAWEFRDDKVRNAHHDEEQAEQEQRIHDYAAAKDSFGRAKVNWLMAGEFSQATRNANGEKNCPQPVPDRPLPPLELARLTGKGAIESYGMFGCTVVNNSSWVLRGVEIHVDVFTYCFRLPG